MNTAGNPVGYDLEMAQRLANDLGVTIELVPFTFETLSRQLRDDHFDVAMSGVYGTVGQSEDIRLSDPYMFATMALVVPDHRDTDFATPTTIRNLKKARVGIHRSLAGESISDTAMSEFANIELVVLDTYRDFFERTGPGKDLDALYTGAESGSAWTLLYPSFQVVTPWLDDFKVPLVYPYNGDNDNQMDEFMDHWVLLKRHDGTTGKAFKHWILGEDSGNRAPRWSVLRNVLGWIE